MKIDGCGSKEGEGGVCKDKMWRVPNDKGGTLKPKESTECDLEGRGSKLCRGKETKGEDNGSSGKDKEIVESSSCEWGKLGFQS